MKRNASRVNNPARLARLRDQAIKLRERVKQSTLAFHERSQARTAWWRRAFRERMVADWAIFTKAKTLLSAFMALLGLAAGKKPSLIDSMVASPVQNPSRKRRRLHIEGLEQRQLLASLPLNLSSVLDEDIIVNRTGGVTDTLQSYMDRSNWDYMTQSYASFVGGTAGPGMPDSGLIPATAFHPEIQLPYNNADNGVNARVIRTDTGSFSFNTPPDNYTAVHIVGVSTEGRSRLQITLTYTTGSAVTSSIITIPDWFDDFTETTSQYYLLNGMDRANYLGNGNVDNSNNPGVFGFRFATDPTRILSSVTVSKITSNPSLPNYFVFFGAYGENTNVAPTITVKDSTVAFAEGSRGSNIFTAADSDGTIFGVDASSGATLRNGNGTWSWSSDPEDGPLTETVSVLARDNRGEVVRTSFILNVSNVAPTATFSNGGTVSEGSTGSVSFSAQKDPSSEDRTAGFHYAYDFDNNGAFDFGDGTYAGSGTSPSATVPASYLTAGSTTRTVKGRILDKDGGFNDYTTDITIVTRHFVYHAPFPMDLDVYVRDSADPAKAVLVVRHYGTGIELQSKKLSEIDKLVDITTGGNVYIQTGLWTDGDDVSVSASEIYVSGTISTVDRSGGAAPPSAGKITLIARNKSNNIVSGIADAIPIFGEIRSAKITLANANLDVGAVEIKAEGQSGARWDDVGGIGAQIAGPLLSRLQALPQIALSLMSPISGQAKVHSAKANITLENATIKSKGNVAIGADAFADASINAISLGGTSSASLPVSISLAFSHSFSEASIDLNGSSKIEAAGNIKIRTDALSKSKVDAKSDANTGNRKGIEFAFNLALAMTEEKSTIMVSQDTLITSSGSIDIASNAKVHNESQAATNLYQDGTGALTVALGFDDANVKTEVHGKVTSQDKSTQNGFTLAAAQVLPKKRQIELKNVPSSEVVNEGDRMRFESDAAVGAYGLVPGETYTVESVTNSKPLADGTIDQSFRLRRGQVVSLDARQVSKDSKHSLSTIGLANFKTSDVIDVSTQLDKSGVVKLTDLPAGVTKLTYRGPKFENSVISSESGELLVGIDGLIQDQDYDIVTAIDGGYHLRLPNNPKYVQFKLPTLTAAQATQIHAFSYTKNVQKFVPSNENVVDPKANTIKLNPGHGLKTGDFVIYETDGAKTVQKKVNYYDKDGKLVESLGDVNLPDAPIDGLGDHRGYRVIVDPSDPNLIRLSSQIQMETTDGSATPKPTADTVVLNKNAPGGIHRLVPVNLVRGINISSSLYAENTSGAGSTMSDEEQPASELVSNSLNGRIDSIATGGMKLIDSLRKGATTNAVTKAADKAKTVTGSGTNFDVAGSFALNIFNHHVETKIGSSAHIFSNSDLTVDGKIEQKTQLSASAEATRNGVGKSDGSVTTPSATTPPPPTGGEKGDEIEIAAAVAVGVYSNVLKVTITDGAVVNAFDDLQVNAKVEYPLLSDSILDAINPVKSLQENGLAGFEDILDGIGGIGQMFNVNVVTLAGTEKAKLALGGGVAVTYVTNEVTAEIGKDVSVNQAETPPPFTPDLTQSVTVTAELTAKVIEVGQQSSFNLNLDGAASVGEKLFSKDFANALSDLVVPFGVSGKNAIGGVMLLSIVDNKVTAKIHDNAKVAAKDRVSVDAKNAYSNISVVQTGTASTDFGFTAAIAVGVFDLKTIASIDETVTIITGKLAVNAEDESDRITIAGGFLKGKQVGIGTSVGVNVVDQRVDAFIGRLTPNSNSPVPSNKLINASEEVNVTATTKGEIFALVMAGAAQGGRPEKPAAKAQSSTSTSKSKTLGPVALTIPVAINIIDSGVRAYIDQQNFDTKSVKVEALTETSVLQVVVGASFAVQVQDPDPRGSEGKLTLGGAGAVALALLTQNATAFIQSSQITATGSDAITVTATDKSKSDIYAGGIGVAGSFTKGGKAAISFGASVAINDIDGATKAYISESQITASGAVNVKAIGNAKIFTLSIAGGASASVSKESSGAFAGGGTVSINDIEKTLEASIQSSTKLTVLTNSPTVISATDQSEIFAIAGAASIAVSVSADKGIAGALGIALSINDIHNTTKAKLDHSTVDTRDDLTIHANSKDAKIISAAVAASIGESNATGVSVSLAAAGAGSLNHIGNTVSATMTNSNVTFREAAVPDTGAPETGRLNVIASDTSNIASLAFGAAISVAIGTSNSVAIGFGASLGLNEIKNTLSATIDASNITFQGAVTGRGTIDVVASDKSTIKSTAIGAAISAAVGGSQGVAVGIGISLGFNEINNTAQAVIKTNTNITGSPTNKKQFDINVTATQDSTINTTAVAAAVGAAVGGTVGVGVSGAGALAKNEISNRTLANIVDSSLDVSGNLNVTAQDKATIDGFIIAASVAGGVSGTAGVGVAFGVSSVINTIPDTALTQAMIRGSRFVVNESLLVDASSTGTVNSNVNAASIGFAVGQVGVAVALAGVLASHDLKGMVEAQILDSNQTENQAEKGVTVKASNNITSNLVVLSASASAAVGEIAVAASVSVASAQTTLAPKVAATIRNTKLRSNSGNIAVTAENTTKVTNEAATASLAVAIGIGGSVAGGGSLATVTANPQVVAIIQDSDIDASGVIVKAISTDTIDADAKAAAISLGLVGIGAAGSISSVTLEPKLQSEVARTKVKSDNGKLEISTQSNPLATAESAGLAVSTGASVGISKSDVTIGGSLISRLDSSGKSINVAALNIHADNNAAPAVGKSSSAQATGASGGLLIGLNGAIANITNKTTSTAEIADNKDSNLGSSVITVIGKTDIRANSATSQTAEAGSLAVGLRSSGNTLTEAKSDNETTARIGKNVRLTTGDLDLQSISVDNNISTAKVGAFGGRGIALSKGDTTTKSITKAIIDDRAELTIGKKLDADAKHTSKYNANLLSLSGGIISGTGGAVKNVIDSTVNVTIGNSTFVNAGRMDATATNIVEKMTPSTDGVAANSVDAIAGGLIAGDYEDA